MINKLRRLKHLQLKRPVQNLSQKNKIHKIVLNNSNRGRNKVLGTIFQMILAE